MIELCIKFKPSFNFDGNSRRPMYATSQATFFKQTLEGFGVKNVKVGAWESENEKGRTIRGISLEFDAAADIVDEFKKVLKKNRFKIVEF